MGSYISLPCGQKSKQSKPSVSVVVEIVEISASVASKEVKFLRVGANPCSSVVGIISRWPNIFLWFWFWPLNRTELHWTKGFVYLINNFNRIWFTTTQTTLFNNNSVGEQHTPTAGIVFIVDSSLLVLLKIYPLERSLCCCERRGPRWASWANGVLCKSCNISRVSVLIRARLWEIEAPLYFHLKNRIFQTFLTKNLHFALFICQYGFFFVPLRTYSRSTPIGNI